MLGEQMKRKKKSKKKFVPDWIDKTDYGIFDESIKHPDNRHRSFDCEKKMLDIDDFIDWQVKIVGHKKFYMGISDAHLTKLKKLIDDGEFEWFSFVIEFDNKGNLEDWQEGRHRAVLFKKMGIDKVPVYFCKRRY